MSEPTATVEAHERYGLPFDVDPSGTTLLTGGFDGSVGCWSVGDWTETTRFAAHEQSVNCGGFRTDDRFVTGSTDGTLRGWRLPVDGGAAFTLAEHAGTVAALAVDRERDRAASASYDETVRLWDLAEAAPKGSYGGHAGNVTSVVFGADGELLVAGGIGDEALVWDVEGDGDEPVARLPGHGAAVVGLSRGPDRAVWSVGYGGDLFRWSVPDGERLATAALPEGTTPSGLAVDPADERLAVTVEHGTLVLDADGTVRSHHETSIKGVSAPCWTPDGEYLLTGGADGTVRIYPRDGE